MIDRRAFATLKIELDHDAAWPTRDAVRRAVFDYIGPSTNAQRHRSTLGHLSLVAFEREWQQTEQ